jgi:glycosyltransferase involved in cell wall biosynthesis
MRVALVHDWLTGMRGGEKCLEVLCQLWPDAHLYTLLHRRGHLSPHIERMDIRTSFLQHLPGVFEHYRYLLPLMPVAVESFRLAAYDLVVSLSHCVAKSVRVPRGVPHVCYCFTPMRYAWHMRRAYFGGNPLRDAALALLRRWDRVTARRVTHFVAISRTVQQRIAECYGRASRLIYPPVNTAFYRPAALPRGDYYLCVSALAPYKRVDLAVAACSRLGRALVVIGSGQDESRVRALAGPSVRFLGWQPDDVIREHYRRCRALVFPGVEDFGIVPLEAQACGTPVLAYGAGGATETVIAPSPHRPGTGLLFGAQSVEALVAAMLEFEQRPEMVSGNLARAHAARFDTARFAGEITEHLGRVVTGRGAETASAGIMRRAA